MVGNAKNSVKKDQNLRFSDLFVGLVELLHGVSSRWQTVVSFTQLQILQTYLLRVRKCLTALQVDYEGSFRFTCIASRNCRNFGDDSNCYRILKDIHSRKIRKKESSTKGLQMKVVFLRTTSSADIFFFWSPLPF